MKNLFVYADFDWMETPQLIGELSYDSVRGSETYGFSFDKEWLAKYGDVFLSEDLQNYTGIQYARPEHDIFTCFSDALPDRWGRTLLNRREQIAATDEKRAVLRLTSFDYLMLPHILCLNSGRLRNHLQTSCHIQLRMLYANSAYSV